MFFKHKKYFQYAVIVLLVVVAFSAEASETDGTINATNNSALLCANDDCSSTSEINFLTTNGTPVHITDSAITGEIWSENMGWINLNPTQSGVTNTDAGVLGGYAWGENTGWINFSPTEGGVSINASGQFSGWAWAQNAGWIKFDCAVVNACVETDWRPASERISDSSSSGSSGRRTVPADPPVQIPAVDLPMFPAQPIFPGQEPPVIDFMGGIESFLSPSVNTQAGSQSAGSSSSADSAEPTYQAEGENVPESMDQATDETEKPTFLSKIIDFFKTIINEIVVFFINICSLIKAKIIELFSFLN